MYRNYPSPRAHALQQEKPRQWEDCTQLEGSLCSPQLEKSPHSDEDKDPEQPTRYIHIKKSESEDEKRWVHAGETEWLMQKPVAVG